MFKRISFLVNIYNPRKLRYLFSLLFRYRNLPTNSFLNFLNNGSLQETDNETLLKDLYPLNEGELCLVCPWGIGDTLMTAGLVHEIKKTYQIKSVMLLVKHNHSYIPSVFPSVDRICILEDKINFIDKENITLDIKNKKLEPNNYFLAHFENYSIPYLIGYKNINLFDCYRALFKIDLNSKLELPIELDNSRKYYCVELFKKNKLRKGKTVLLATEASSLSSFPIDFWASICKVLKDRNYDIVLNSKLGIDILSSYAVFIDIPLDYLVDFSILAGRVIALRSGLCDFLSLYKVNLTVLYPKMTWYNGTLIQGAGIAKMGFSGEVNEFEIDHENGESLNFFDYLYLL